MPTHFALKLQQEMLVSVVKKIEEIFIWITEVVSKQTNSEEHRFKSFNPETFKTKFSSKTTHPLASLFFTECLQDLFTYLPLLFNI